MKTRTILGIGALIFSFLCMAMMGFRRHDTPSIANYQPLSAPTRAPKIRPGVSPTNPSDPTPTPTSTPTPANPSDPTPTPSPTPTPKNPSDPTPTPAEPAREYWSGL